MQHVTPGIQHATRGMGHGTLSTRHEKWAWGIRHEEWAWAWAWGAKHAAWRISRRGQSGDGRAFPFRTRAGSPAKRGQPLRLAACQSPSRPRWRSRPRRSGSSRAIGGFPNRTAAPPPPGCMPTVRPHNPRRAAINCEHAAALDGKRKAAAIDCEKPRKRGKGTAPFSSFGGRHPSATSMQRERYPPLALFLVWRPPPRRLGAATASRGGCVPRCGG